VAVGRDFALGDAATSAHLGELFSSYYARVATALETMQRLLDRDGPGGEVNVSADVAAVRVRQIVQATLAEQPSVTQRSARRGRPLPDAGRSPGLPSARSAQSRRMIPV